MPGGKLYVFLHGLMVCQDSGNEIEVVLPLITGHVFKAGNWLRETPIDLNADLRLEGVDLTGAGMVSALDATIRLQGASLDRGPRAATLRLPRPAVIHQLLLSSTVVQTAAAPPLLPVTISTPKGVATLLVFQYTFADENQLSLRPNAPAPPGTGHYWEPASTDGAISLHIVATSEDWEGNQHDIDAQAVLKQLVRGYPGLVTPFFPPGAVPNWQEPNLPPTPPAPAIAPPVGLNCDGQTVRDGVKFAFAQAELEPINSRGMRLNWLGRTKQQGRPLENVWHEPEPLGDYPPVCSPLVCG